MSANSATIDIVLRVILLLAELKMLYLVVSFQLSAISCRQVEPWYIPHFPCLNGKLLWGVPHKNLGQATSLHEHKFMDWRLGLAWGADGWAGKELGEKATDDIDIPLRVSCLLSVDGQLNKHSNKRLYL